MVNVANKDSNSKLLLFDAFCLITLVTSVGFIFLTCSSDKFTFIPVDNISTILDRLSELLASFVTVDSTKVEVKEYVPEEELIAAGVYNLDQEDWIDLLTLVRKSNMPQKQRDRLQYKLSIMLYQKYVD